MSTKKFDSRLLKIEEKLSRFAKQLTRNNEDANDLLQETYLKVINSDGQFAEYTNLHAWTCTIMRNTFINNYRRKVDQNTII